MAINDLEVLYSITKAVHQSFDLQHVYNTALDMVLTLKDVDMAFIYMISEDRKSAILQAHRNLTDDYLEKASIIPYPKGMTWKLLSSGQVINVEDVQKEKDVGPAGKQIGHRRGLGIPIILEGVVMGCIWLTSFNTGKFSEQEVKLNVSVGQNIGIAIAKAKLYEELEENIKTRTAELEKTSSLLRKAIDEQKKAEIEIKTLREQQEFVDSINRILARIGSDDSPVSKMSEHMEEERSNNGSLHKSLSSREYNIMLMIASGKKIKSIARETYLSASTVSTYRSRILEKLNLETTADLIRYAIKNDLLT